MIRTAILSFFLFTASHLAAQEQEVKLKIKNDCAKSGSIALGPQAGVSFANGSVWVHNRLSTGLLVKPRFGIVAEFETMQNLFIQPAIAYTTYGYWIVHNPIGGKVSLRVHALEFPLNVQYKFGGANGSGPFFGAGLYYAVTTSAIQTDNTAPKSKRELSVGPDEDDDIARSMFGWSVNAGYQMSNGIFFRAAWQNGITDYIPGNQAAAYHPYQANVTVGYLFKMAKQKTPKATS